MKYELILNILLKKKMVEMMQFRIHFMNEEKQFQVNTEDADNIRAIKKKILTKFGYEQSQGKNIHLQFVNVYNNQPADIGIPITYEQDYRFIVDFLIEQERIIQLKVYQFGDLRQKQQFHPRQQLEVEYDENGSVISNGNINDNIPRQQLKYRGQQIVRCSFCNKNNKDTSANKICGGIYGPFSKNRFTHLNCALWCYEVFLNEEGDLMEQFINNKPNQINKVFKNAAEKKCYYCKKVGSGLKCKNCDKKFHYQCGYDRQCAMNWENFMVLCHLCAKNQTIYKKQLIQPKGYQFISKESGKQGQKIMDIEEDLSREDDYPIQTEMDVQ